MRQSEMQRGVRILTSFVLPITNQIIHKTDRFASSLLHPERNTTLLTGTYLVFFTSFFYDHREKKIRQIVRVDYFRFGSIYEYKDDGIEAAGNVDNGECGIKIRNIGYEKSGTWKCEVVRKQRPGSTILGSEVTASSIRVDVFRTSRLNDDNVQLQVRNSFFPFMNCFKK